MYAKTQRPSFKYNQNKTIFLVYINIITLGRFTLTPMFHFSTVCINNVSPSLISSSCRTTLDCASPVVVELLLTVHPWFWSLETKFLTHTYSLASATTQYSGKFSFLPCFLMWSRTKLELPHKVGRGKRDKWVMKVDNGMQASFVSHSSLNLGTLNFEFSWCLSWHCEKDFPHILTNNISISCFLNWTIRW